MKVHLPTVSKKPFLKVICSLPLLALLLAGCANPDYTAVMAPPDPKDTGALAGARFHVGDSLVVTYGGVPDQLPPQEKTIGEDGNIILPDIGAVKAAGQTPGELDVIIHDKYVPAIYKHLDVSVKAGERVFYVRGEVANKGRQIYVGQMTVTKAITSAGDFTDFGNPKNVLLIRSNGQRFVVNCRKILSGEAPDPPVYPGDQIEVRRRRF